MRQAAARFCVGHKTLGPFLPIGGPCRCSVDLGEVEDHGSAHPTQQFASHAAVPAAGTQPHLSRPPPGRVRPGTHSEALTRIVNLGELVSPSNAWLIWLEVEHDFHRVREVVSVPISIPHLNDSGPTGDVGIGPLVHLNRLLRTTPREYPSRRAVASRLGDWWLPSTLCDVISFPDDDVTLFHVQDSLQGLSALP